MGYKVPRVRNRDPKAENSPQNQVSQQAKHLGSPPNYSQLSHPMAMQFQIVHFRGTKSWLREHSRAIITRRGQHSLFPSRIQTLTHALLPKSTFSTNSYIHKRLQEVQRPRHPTLMDFSSMSIASLVVVSAPSFCLLPPSFPHPDLYIPLPTDRFTSRSSIADGKNPPRLVQPFRF